jgi:uncharacterized protein YndB with AHSA1/START domain
MVIRKAISLACPVERAFELFTSGISTWWPSRTHSVGEERVETVVFEERLGGRIYERWDDGTECDWGTVVVWDPPNRVVFSWQPNREQAGETEVEVRFAPEHDGTRVELDHRGWDRLGDEGNERHERYTSGWDRVLGAFADAARGLV